MVQRQTLAALAFLFWISNLSQTFIKPCPLSAFNIRKVLGLIEKQSVCRWSTLKTILKNISYTNLSFIQIFLTEFTIYWNCQKTWIQRNDEGSTSRKVEKPLLAAVCSWHSLTEANTNANQQFSISSTAHLSMAVLGQQWALLTCTQCWEGYF